MADRIAVMRSGLIEQVATPHGIFAKPANLFVAGFIGTPQMNLDRRPSSKVSATMVGRGSRWKVASGWHWRLIPPCEALPRGPR